ncbi:hypothetical protein RND71_025800 [Anisodus tanguticus]|uniref:S-acyltransferase n=1 Tax=Anisodus tanguticus TaxID=243964 RepID=A0AAE1V7Q7_9SOLA|nr:hypothetical protein RND71_025800 [Anisodus tanguticus]
MELKKFLSIHILCVLIFVGFLYYVTIFIFLDDLLSLQSSTGKFHSLFFTFVASFCVFSFFVCVLKDPGGVPSSYLPDVEYHEASDQESKRCGLLKKKCDKCSEYKPPRTHHCRICRRCILRMDHHCAWINNCVGHRNYKAFITLIFYGTIAAIYSSVILVSNALHKDWNFDGVMPLKLFYIATGVVVIGLSVTLGTLLGWHIYLTIRNMTTIEYYEGTRAAWLASKSGLNYHHPYDVGAYKNISLVLGPNMLKWLCPTAVSHIKDGLSFPTLREYS